jgi:hypothetical protein
MISFFIIIIIIQKIFIFYTLIFVAFISLKNMIKLYSKSQTYVYHSGIISPYFFQFCKSFKYCSIYPEDRILNGVSLPTIPTSTLVPLSSPS